LPSRVNDQYRTPNVPGCSRVEQRMVATFRSSPLPSAEELQRYKEIMPDLPERLVGNWERQTEHRISLETKVIDGDVSRSKWGLIAGWSFAMALLAASVFLISTGHESIGVTALLIELAALGGSLVYSDYRRRRERNRKADG
jgi:uncharacterized membrane protein